MEKYDWDALVELISRVRGMTLAELAFVGNLGKKLGFITDTSVPMPTPLPTPTGPTSGASPMPPSLSGGVPTINN